jgi:hypothetical protein
MKREKSTVLLVTVLLFAGMVFSGGIFAAELNGVIQACYGNVEVKPDPNGEWVPARAGMALNSGSFISTGFKSSAIVVIGSANILIRPLTCLSLGTIIEQRNSDQIDLKLQTGRIRVEVKPPQDRPVNFTVSSPIATASVRGTEFDFDAVNLVVQNGTVAYTGLDKATVFATAGKTSFIDRQDRSTVPVSVEERQMSQIIFGPAGSELLPPTLSPVSPVVAGRDGIFSVPGTIGNPGGGVSNSPPVAGNAWVGSTWQD